MFILLLLSFLLLMPLDLYSHVPGASRGVAPGFTGLNTKAPNFVLLDQDGNRFDSATLRGKVVVLNFIFTTCTDVCPVFTANLAQLQRTLKDQRASNVFLVSITTDPEVDSPKVLKAYAQRYGADFQNWAFLTGSDAQLKPVWKGFGVRVINKGRGLVQHTSLTTVIDPQGIRRFNYFGEKWQLKDLLRDVSLLLEDKPKPGH
ncbi:MAG TPA: SCO family protein [Candidatus Binatia bacterium]|nr:SCO family protein [Candidatus Binatia bacterium]